MFFQLYKCILSPALCTDFSDVAYNYMVGNDGVIYEGRGQYQSESSEEFDSKMIFIGFLGIYVTSNPTDDAIDVANIFLQYLVDQSKFIGCGEIKVCRYSEFMLRRALCYMNSNSLTCLFIYITENFALRKLNVCTFFQV